MHISKDKFRSLQENCRTIPLLSSSIYGHRLPSDLDPVNRQHGHVEIVKAEFYRKNGLNIQPDDKGINAFK